VGLKYEGQLATSKLAYVQSVLMLGTKCHLNLRAKRSEMATEFCQRCKQSHPGRLCDYDDEGECAEMVDRRDSSEGDVESTRALPRDERSIGSKE
jgi:hypothetical protein